MSPTICISCGRPMTPAGDRAPSIGNPNQCVPCCTGINLPDVGTKVGRAVGSGDCAGAVPAADQTCSTAPDAGDRARFPADGSAAYSPKDGAQFTPPTATVVNHRLHGKIGWLYQEDDGSLTLHTRLDIPAGAIIKLPPATAPRPLPSGRDAGPETTAAGGNPFPGGRWTDLGHGCGTTVPGVVAATKPAAASPGAGYCIKCGGPVPRGVATVCCADCAAGFRTPPPPLPDEPWDAESEALTLELRRRGIQSIPADTRADDEWRMLL